MVGRAFDATFKAASYDLNAFTVPNNKAMFSSECSKLAINYGNSAIQIESDIFRCGSLW
jgi:hypothetical protein